MSSILNRSHYSLGFGSADIKNIVSYAKSAGLKSVALTDVNTLAGIPDFLSECERQGIHPVVGLTIKVTHDGKPLGELAFLAKNESGYKRLVELLDRSTVLDAKKMSIHTPVALVNEFLKDNTDLLLVDGFAGSVMHRQESGDKLYFAGKAKNNYVVAETPNVPSDVLSNVDFQAKLKELGVIYRVASASVSSFVFNEGNLQDPSYIASLYRYQKQCNEAGIQDEMSAAVVKGFHASKPDLLTKWLEFKSDAYSYKGFMLLDSEAFTNTHPPIFDKSEKLDVLGGRKVEDLAPLMHARLEEYFAIRGIVDDNKMAEYRERLDDELSVFESVPDASEYILNNYTITELARRHGIDILVRGSGASSLCVFLMQDTFAALDPLELGLTVSHSFRRFMDAERVSMPDIDIDVTDTDAMLSVLIKELGQSNVFRLKSFGTIKTIKPSIKTALEALSSCGMVKDMGAFENASKEILTFLGNADGLTWNEMASNPKFTDFITGERYKKHLASVAKRLSGLNRSITLHNSGLVLSAGAELDMLPKAPTGTNERVLDVHYKAVSKVSEIKYDALLKAEAPKHIYAIEKEMKARGIATLSHDVSDPIIYRPFQHDAFAEGYQVSGFSTARVVNVIQPRDFAQLMACVQLAKEGGVKLAEQYKRGMTQGANTGSPLMDKHLKDTFGVILYDEQIISFCMDVAGMSFSDADGLRAAYKSKDKETVFGKIAHFEKCALEQGVSTEELADITRVLRDRFDVYTAPKAHVAAYAKVIARQMHCKMYAPDLYMKEYCKDQKMFLDMNAEYKRLGVEFMPMKLSEIRPYSFPRRDGDIQEITPGFIDAISKEFYLAARKFNEYCTHQLKDQAVTDVDLMEVIHHLTEYTLMRPLPILTNKSDSGGIAQLKTDLVVAVENGVFDDWLPQGDIFSLRKELTQAVPDIVDDIIGLEPNRHAELNEMSKLKVS